MDFNRLIATGLHTGRLMTCEEHADENVNKACLFRDNLYRLTLTSLTDLEHASWSAPEDKVNTCQNKGQSVEDCHNYVKVLLSNGKSLFTCGTYAFSPWCAWREVCSPKVVCPIGSRRAKFRPFQILMFPLVVNRRSLLRSDASMNIYHHYQLSNTRFGTTQSRTTWVR